MSPVSDELPRICEGKFHILGDGAYEIREWLITPFRNYENLNVRKQTFNDKFCATRVLIENSFGILKNRFRQLIRVDMHEVERICKFVISCCVLHNLCIDGDEHVDEINNETDDDTIDDEDRTTRGTLLRRLGEDKRLGMCDLFS